MVYKVLRHWMEAGLFAGLVLAGLVGLVLLDSYHEYEATTVLTQQAGQEGIVYFFPASFIVGFILFMFCMGFVLGSAPGFFHYLFKNRGGKVMVAPVIETKVEPVVLPLQATGAAAVQPVSKSRVSSARAPKPVSRSRVKAKRARPKKASKQVSKRKRPLKRSAKRK
ncbi:MAG: hypothetical protein ABIH41_05685 [Nanoarchaeota archaeon]